MSNLRTQYETTTPFIARFTSSGTPILNATGVIFIYRVSGTKEYWNGSSWQTARVSVSMTEISETNQPGDWIYLFDNSVGISIDEYVIEMVDTSGNSDNPIERLALLVGGYIDPIVESISRLLGLSHENFVLDPTSQAVTGVMTAGDVYIYDNATNATADLRTVPGGLTYKYHVEAPHSLAGILIKFTQTLVAI